MLDRLKPKSEFSRNVLTLMTGTTVAQAIPIAISPILTRLYTPEDFGILALFIAITSIFGSIANGRYELAIMLPRKDEDAINILALGFIINFSLSLILFFIVIIFHDNILNLLNNEAISPWLYLVPVSVFLMGCFNLLNYFNNRIKLYKDLAKANVVKAVAMAVVQLSLGFLKAGAFGLLSGHIVSQIASNTKLFFNIKKLNLFKKVKKINIIVLAKRYKDFPKFSMWAILANTLSLHLINLIISLIYNISTLGFYSLVQKVLGMPIIFIGSSIGQVFFQKATIEKQQSGQADEIFLKILKQNIIIGLPIFLLLYFIIEDVFILFFGEEWKVAGAYAKISIPLYFIRFIVIPLMVIDTIFEKQKIYLVSQVIYLISNIIIIYIFHNFEFEYVLNILIAYSTLHFIVYLYALNLISKGKL